MSIRTPCLPLAEQLSHALHALRLPGAASKDTFVERFPRMAVAYSGGLDSTVLLHLAAVFARTHGVQLLALHIHHGISANADDWQQHCRRICARLDIGFDTGNITLNNDNQGGLEEAARLGRYHALGQLCRTHGVKLLLTAHHRDDQAETMLLQILRGAGVAGMSGMDRANLAPALLGNPDLLLARPLLAVARSQLAHHAQVQSWSFVDDESNCDMRYARNALRQRIMPALTEFFPGFQERVARAAGHAQSAQRLLVVLAKQDFAACLDGEYLSVPALRNLDPDRLDNLLRYWLALRGLRMPSAAWLQELRRQLLEAKDDAQVCVTHPDCHIRRYRERVFLTPRAFGSVFDCVFNAHGKAETFTWQGQPILHFPRFAGSLFFVSAAHGLPADWLRTQTLSLRVRSGGERLKLAWNRPGKSLKYHYQSLDIPAWERPYLPIVFAGAQLLYAAGIGMDCQAAQPPGEGGAHTCMVLRWQADLY